METRLGDGPRNHELTSRRTWFRVTMGTAHRGAGHQETHTNYVYARNTIEAIYQAKRMRGVKTVDQARQLEDDEIGALMEIVRELKISITTAKKRGIYGIRADGAELETLLRERVEERTRRNKSAEGQSRTDI